VLVQLDVDDVALDVHRIRRQAIGERRIEGVSGG
jgi:hypothetical protein